jgi:hypothetical protein
MTKDILVAIFGAFAPMSVLMFGGANSIIPSFTGRWSTFTPG